MPARRHTAAHGVLRDVVLPWLVGALLAVGVLLALPVVALGQAPACPDAPVEYVGTDDVVNELRALRVDERASCLAVTDRLQAVDASLGLLEVEADAGARHAALLAAVEANAPVDGSAAVVEAVELSKLDQAAALWFLAGLLCALFAGALFAREVLA